MISSLFVIFFLSFVKLLFEDNLLLILMSMEMVTIISFFSILFLNPETLALTACTITMLTVMISESVLSLAIFISLMRYSSTESISSLSLSR